MENIAAIILQIFILLVFAKVLGGVFEKYKMPKLIGEILAGLIFINLIVFNIIPGNWIGLEISDVHPFADTDLSKFFHIMGELGIIFLLFAVGLETRFSDMMKVGKSASYIAILGVVIPFVGGALFWFHEMIDLNAALLVGAALFGTSTAVGVECLRNLDAMNTNEAKLIISATIIDDILCLALLSIIIGAIRPDADTLSIVLNAVIVIAFVLFMFFFVSRIKKIVSLRRKRIQRRLNKNAGTEEHITEEEPKPMGELGALGIAVLVCLGLAAFSVNIGLAAIIGAFLAGMIFAEFKDTMPVEHNFNVIIYFMLPFFFIWVGMEVQFNIVTTAILPLLGAVLLVAVGTKYAAGFIGGKMGKLSNDSSHLIGVSFIPRGEVGIIVATIGLTSGVFTPDVFTVIILMALITSVITPPLVAHAYRKIEKHRSEVFEELFIEEHNENG
ncbi:MAG: cation:proton antiporter [Methanomassiliicoccaceae archaeon]|nr:cation:proton antiporter [Methanomassiliicoccaceae archaeon]